MTEAESEATCNEATSSVGGTSVLAQLPESERWDAPAGAANFAAPLVVQPNRVAVTNCSFVNLSDSGVQTSIFPGVPWIRKLLGSAGTQFVESLHTGHTELAEGGSAEAISLHNMDGIEYSCARVYFFNDLTAGLLAKAIPTPTANSKRSGNRLEGVDPRQIFPNPGPLAVWVTVHAVRHIDSGQVGHEGALLQRHVASFRIWVEASAPGCSARTCRPLPVA
ncbi:unnamed protein product [Symbiodinium microadriaticum]|nr:unnamed protein product [Symbiodinium microadriaticum]